MTLTRVINKFNKLLKPYEKTHLNTYPLCNLPGTQTDAMENENAEKTLSELLSKILPELNYLKPAIEIKPISSDGANYTSTLYLITVSEEKKETLNLFAKLACISDKVREVFDKTKPFETEALVYDRLQKNYIKLQEKYKVNLVDRFIFPKFYGANVDTGSEIMVLENLKAAGYEDPDRFKSVDWEQASIAIKNLAKFHALSFALKTENPKEFEYFLDKFKYDGEHSFLMISKNLIKLGAWKEGLSEYYKPKIEQFLEEMGDDLYPKLVSPIGQPVIIHFDYRPSNMLFKRQGSKIDVMLVDYQTVNIGCPLIDLVYFIVLGTDGRFRAQYYDRLVGLYYQELSGMMTRLNVDVTDVYPRRKFNSDLKEVLPIAVLFGMLILPVVTVDPDEAPKLHGDTADLSNLSIKPSKLCIERLGELCEDLERWGVI